MPSGNEIWTGSSGEVIKANTQTPEMQKLHKLIIEGLSSGTGPFADLFNFNKEDFQKGVADPAMKNFSENVLPQLQEKFIANNQQLGSGLQKASVKGAAQVQSDISKLLYEAQQGAKQNKLQGANLALNAKPFENIYKPGSEGILQGALTGAAKAGINKLTGNIAG